MEHDNSFRRALKIYIIPILKKVKEANKKSEIVTAL